MNIYSNLIPVEDQEKMASKSIEPLYGISRAIAGP